jgi:outer membrane protein assembly factor BamD
MDRAHDRDGELVSGRTLRALLAALLCSVTLAACRHKSNLPTAGSVDADKYLYDHGTAAIYKRHWLDGREYFKKLVDTYPQSQYRQDAKLGIGDSYLGEDSIESNILAVNEFREFLAFFPGNQRTDYAQYKVAVGYANQMLGPDRDPTPAQDAVNACETFFRNYPTSRYRPDVEKVRRRAKDQLSGHDFKVGLFYYRVKWYPGAIERFKGLLADDPEYTGRDAVYFYLGEMYNNARQQSEALPYYERLVKEFEKSDYLERSKKRIVEVKAALPK